MPALLLVLGPLVAFFGTGYYSGFGAVIAELYPTSVRATAAGVCYNTGRIASAAAPFVVGSLAASRGFFAAFAVAGVAFLLAAIMWIWIPETQQRRADHDRESRRSLAVVGDVRRLHGRRLAGVAQVRASGTAADLIVAGRSMPLWIAALTMTATWVDGGYLLGTTEGAYKNSIQLGIQGGLCFGISLILGGLFFAGIMRRYGFTTLIDPFEARFGKRWAAVLFLPALAGELFWSAELLVAVGSTFGVLLGMNLTTAILLAAVVTTAYTMLGGMWSVAYTDIFQLAIVAIGLCVALPFVLARRRRLAPRLGGLPRRAAGRRRHRAAVAAAHRALELARR